MSNSNNLKSAKCPLCKRHATSDFAPFCSAGCKDRDLLQWLGEGYRVAGPPAEYEDLSSGGEED